MALIGLSAWSQTFEYTYEGSTLEYSVTSASQSKCTVTASSSLANNLSIPQTVSYNDKEYSVTSIGLGAFYACTSLTSVTIPNSVTSIGPDAFSSCSKLADFTIEDGDSPIGFASNAFGDSPIKNLYIGRNWTYNEQKSIGTAISSVTLGNKITKFAN